MGNLWNSQAAVLCSVYDLLGWSFVETVGEGNVLEYKCFLISFFLSGLLAN